MIKVFFRKIQFYILLIIWIIQLPLVFASNIDFSFGRDEVPYLSGQMLYKEIKNKIPHKRIFVPVDYNDLSKGQNPLYFWFAGNGFNKNRPTVIHLHGGPGRINEADSSPLFKGFNIIRLDYRGTRFSRPDKRSDYEDYRYHSFKNIAEDLDRIRQKLGLEQVTIFGESYGTLAARWYAKKYPQHTRALILYGIVDQHSTMEQYVEQQKEAVTKTLSYLNEENRKRFEQKIEVLSPQLKANIPSHISQFDMLFPVAWNNFIEDMLNQLDTNNLDSESNESVHISNKVITMANERISQDEFVRSLVVNAELGESDDSVRLIIEKGLTLSSAKRSSIYSISKYLTDRELFITRSAYNLLKNKDSFEIQVPSFWLNGALDFETPVIGALNRWQNEAKGPSVFIVENNSFHSGLNAHLLLSYDKSVTNHKIYQDIFNSIFKEAALGKISNESDLKVLFDDSEIYYNVPNITFCSKIFIKK